MLWATAPNIDTFMPQGEGSGGKPVRAETHSAFSVNVGDMADSMSVLLDSSKDMVTRYEGLKALVLAADASHTVFGEQATYTEHIPKPSPTSLDKRNAHEPTFAEPEGPLVEADPGVRSAAEKFGPYMYPGMKNVLMECANAIELLGRYIVLLDRAGTYYARADHQSVFPEPSGKSIVDT
ncbi:hypothetical protein [Streptomyces pinistramenti]|uniref:hypothetical protein n=1 Tax=Streptomyces pinistramenti TaxID=2884812 RepID=UPI001D070F7A|nr:hypothetical protein [Streptomyces pinistramenti]MCB5908059.1 hypothetical protein [Streptomyces pinistramenti]